MQEVNEQLLIELEKRDQAVEQAVGLICGLEAEVERLEMDHDVEMHDANDHDYDAEVASSPPTYDRETMSVTPRGMDRSKIIVRMPSFLSEQSEGVEALRSLYLPHSTSYSDVALPKLPEEGSESGMPSPSMSVLSESSFLSIYGQKSPAANEDFDSPPPRQHRRTSSSIEKWVDERPASTMPVQIPSPSSQYSGRRSQFLSMNYVAASPLQRLEKLRNNLEKQYNSSTSLRLKTRSDKRGSIQDRHRSKDDNRRLTIDGNGFEASQQSPPTPDTISTGTLRNYKNSDESLDQRNHADEDDETFNHSASTFAVPPATYDPYESTTSMRPRSAGETVTSRRDGHDWDTETMETDELETHTNSSSESTKVHIPTYQPRNGNQTPEFFSFNTTSSERDNLRLWSADGVYHNYTETRIPSGANSSSRRPSNTAQRYEMPRTAFQVETHPRSDDTITPGYMVRRPQSRIEDHGDRNSYREIERSSTPLDDRAARPPAPDRRSSLAAATSKLKKQAPATVDGYPNPPHNKIPLAPVPASFPNTPVRETSKEKGGKEKDFRRLLPTRLFFGRSETAPANVNHANHTTSNSASSSGSNSNVNMSMNMNIDPRNKYQSLPTRNRYASGGRRTDLSRYQMDSSEEIANAVGLVGRKTYFEEEEEVVEMGAARERSEGQGRSGSATPPPIARNRAHSVQSRRELTGRMSVGARERESGRQFFGADGAGDRDAMGGGERRGARSAMSRVRVESALANRGEEKDNKENDGVKDRENGGGGGLVSTPRKWFGLGVGRSLSISKR